MHPRRQRMVERKGQRRLGKKFPLDTKKKEDEKG
tara:strand:- start:383 stop:484 length:102 start_codon:yes stop_codon:yes gene_type:complete